MTGLSGDARDRLAAALANGHAAYYADPRMVDLKQCQIDTLLPVVAEIAAQHAAEALRAAITKVQAVYDLQCPVMPADRYVGAGARIAHLWWQKVLGGELDDLRDRAAALHPTTEGTTR